MKNKDEIINEAVGKLQELTGADIYGCRSQIVDVIEHVMKEQDRNTRHACAEACGSAVAQGSIYKSVASAFHDLCMNVIAI